MKIEVEVDIEKILSEYSNMNIKEENEKSFFELENIIKEHCQKTIDSIDFLREISKKIYDLNEPKPCIMNMSSFVADEETEKERILNTISKELTIDFEHRMVGDEIMNEMLIFSQTDKLKNKKLNLINFFDEESRDTVYFILGKINRRGDKL